MPNIEVSVKIHEPGSEILMHKVVPFYMDKPRPERAIVYGLALGAAFKALEKEVLPFLYANQTEEK